VKALAADRFMRGIRTRWPFAEPPLAVQAEALKQCAGRSRFAYFMDMGTGKSRLILSEAELLYGAGEIRNLAVVLPNSLKGTWATEAAKVGSGFTVVTWPDKPPAAPGHCLFLINFEAVIASGGPVLEQFLAHNAMLVLDESARVKNPKAKCTKALLALSYGHKYVRLLSGLPAPQNVLDYWAQLRLLGADVNRNWFAFRGRYARMGGYLQKQIVGVQNEEELSRIIESVSFRARKQDWLDLPAKLYTFRDYQLEPAQRKAYGSLLKDLVVLLDSGKVVTAPLAVTQLLKLSQVSSGFIHDAEGRAIDLVLPKDNPKLNLIAEVLDEIPGKVIVFAVFRRTLELMKQRWPDCPFIEGGMKQEDVDKAVVQFNTSNCKAIYCQVQSSKYGLTLLGHKDMPCSTIVYAENSYSLDARLQSEDRAHRVGQTRSVLYIDLLGTKVEHAALSILAAKQELSAAILDRGSALRKALKAEL
jgi:SNF2 family DNA or RNA helicase